MKLLCGLCFLVLLLPLSAAALDRNHFSFSYYDFELRIDPAAQAVAARGKVTIRNLSSQPQPAVPLQISSTLGWRQVEIAGKPVQYVTQPYTTDLDHTGAVSEAIVTLPQPLAPGASVELDVGYSGTIPADATRLTRIGAPTEAAARTEWDQVSEFFTAVRGVGHVAWYPVAMEAANLSENRLFAVVGEWKAREAQASMRVKFCWIAEVDPEEAAETRLTVIANGQAESFGQHGTEKTAEGMAATGCTTYRFSNLGLTVPTFVVGELEALQRTGVTVFYAADHKQYAADYAAAIERVQPFVGEWLGAARERVQIVELNEANAAPFESGAMLFTPLGPTEPAKLDLALVHQAVHAAFPSPRPWIYEGLAQFGQALLHERRQGRRAALDFMTAQLPALVEAERQACGSANAPVSAQPKSAAASPPQNERSTSAPQSPPPLDCAQGQALASSYDEIYPRIKGMYVWWMLRDMLGDATLARVLKAYVAAQDKEPSFVQRLFAAQSQRDLEWFFDDWVYRDRGLPDFRVESAYPRATLTGSYVVTVSVENPGAAGAEVPVRVRAQQGEEQKRLEVRRAAKAVTRIEIAAPPDEVIINDGSVPEANRENNRLAIRQPETPR